LRRVLLLFGLLVGVPSISLAHAPIRQFGDFYAGIFHPVTALEHLVPLLMMAFFVGQQNVRTTRMAVIIIPLLFILGGLIGYFIGESQAIIWINRCSFLIMGILVAIGRVYRPAPVILVISVFALTHGFENLAGIDNSVLLLLFMIGMLVCIAFLSLTGAAAVHVLVKDWQKIAIRVAGSWSAAVGVLILALLLINT